MIKDKRYMITLLPQMSLSSVLIRRGALLLALVVVAPLCSAQEKGAGEARKSRFIAAVSSLALPGMGELYAGAYDRGQYFTIAEGVAWIGYAGMLLYGNAALADSRTFAADHAGAQVGGKPDQFFTNVGNFLTTDEYNDKKARDGDFRLVYTTTDYRWAWDSDANRADFRTMLVRANGIVDGTKYIVAAIVANHFLSAIDAVLAVNRWNARLSSGVSRDMFGYRTSIDVQLRF